MQVKYAISISERLHGIRKNVTHRSTADRSLGVNGEKITRRIDLRHCVFVTSVMHAGRSLGKVK